MNLVRNFLFMVIFLICLTNPLPDQTNHICEQIESMAKEAIPELSDTLIQHEPINITSNNDLITQGWPGDGTPSDPFVISGLNISADEYAISIANTNVHILITDCMMVSTSDESIGIRVFNSSNCRINNTIITGQNIGIVMINSNYTDISNSFFISNIYNARIFECKSISFRSSYFASSQSIVFSKSSSCSFTDVQFFNCSNAISFSNSINMTIDGLLSTEVETVVSIANSNNVLINNITTVLTKIVTIGILLSADVAIHNSNLDLGVMIIGFVVEDWAIDFDNVYVNSKPLLYLYGESSYQINATAWGQIIIVNCHNMTIFEGLMQDGLIPIQIAFSSSITVSNIWLDSIKLMGIYITNSQYISVNECHIYNCKIGIEIDFSEYVEISNSVFDNNVAPIAVFFSSSCLIENNSIYNSDQAITMFSTLYSNITLNILKGGSFGIIDVHCKQCYSMSNLIEAFSEAGIFLQSSNGNWIYNNTITENLGDGIRANYTFGLVITKNTIRANQGFGAIINHGESLLAYSNIFDSNAMGNAYSTAIYSQWDNGSIGNYWSDYNGTGIYAITGNGKNVDRYPMALGDADITPPKVTAPETLTFTAGDPNAKLEIEIWDSNPITFILYLNGEPYSLYSWETDTIIIDLSQLPAGTYNFTIVVFDEANNVVKWTTIVQIDVPPMVIAQYSIIVVSGIAVIVVLVREIRIRKS